MMLLSSILPNIDVTNPSTMIPLVAGTGFLDGIHPCAIAILIFFIAFLLTMQKSFKNIFGVGLIYIFVIFLTYLAVGVGLFSGIMLFGQHLLFAKLGSWLLILLGLINIKDYFYPDSPLHLRMPRASVDKITANLKKATIPSVIVAAFLVGLCSIPCSGGIYAAVTSLLASKTTYVTGFLYLMLYNIMFVMPLLIILALSTNPVTLNKFSEWQQKNKRNQRLIMGLFMILLGIAILTFFV